jgi:murein DD-endopeptidase MepM/ murein hydrolase activator NlpD
LAALAGPALAAAPELELDGRLAQSGFAIGRTAPRARVYVDGKFIDRASADGLFVVGFDRDAPSQVTVKVIAKGGEATRVLDVAKTDYDIQRIDGLPRDQVEPSDPALLARIRAEARRKAVGFASNADSDNFKDGFIMPVQATRQSSRFGGQRILNGVPKRPHYGADLAAPIGTPVVAPAPGVVSFAETGLHFEGGLIMIDHGQGLISLYLHLSKVVVAKGDMVNRGQPIGEVGMEGRATGPHLCWRLKWHGRNLDPTLLVGARAPQL